MSQEEKFIIKLDDQLVGGLKKADAAIDQTREKFGAMQAAVFGAAIFAAATAEISRSIDAWNESEQAIAQVRQGLESTGGAAGRTLEQLQKQASELQGKTLFGDDDIMQNVTAKLLTFTNITGEAFDRTQRDALDLATRMGTDAGGAAIQLGKALNDPIQGMNALRRVGVSFTEQQKQQVTQMQNAGNLAGAQAIVFAELEKEFGGSAEAAAKAGTGGFKILANSINDNEETIGGMVMSVGNGLLPVLTKLNDLVGVGLGFLQKHSSAVKIVAAALGAAIGVIGAITLGWQLWTAAVWLWNAALTANPIGLIVIGIAALTAAVAVAWNEFAEFRGAIKGVWAVLEQVYTNITTKFTSIPGMIIDAFKGIPTAIKNIFSGLGDLISAILTGNFDDVPKLLANIGNEALKANPLTAVPAKLISEFTEGTGDAFKKVYDKEINDDKESTLAKAAKKNGEKNSAGGVTSPTGIGAGISEIKAGAPKTFNITFGNLVREMTIQTTNLVNDPSKVKGTIEELMLNVLNNMQVISG